MTILVMLPFWIILSAGTLTTCSHIKKASVSYDASTKKFTIHPAFTRTAIANGSFRDDISTTGWSYLEVKSSPLYKDSFQAYAAGLVEGFLTKNLIKKQYFNVGDTYCKKKKKYCKRLAYFLKKNLKFVNANIKTQGRTKSYWHQVALILEQLKGIEDAYGNTTKKPSTNINVMGPVHMLNVIDADLIELEIHLKKKGKKRTFGSGSCSALVKVLKNDIYFSHVTWSEYSTMLRILKKFTLKFRTSTKHGAPIIPGHTMTFSSEPALIHSLDDFYLISSGLATMETTIGVDNNTLFKNLKPQGCVLEWTRNVLANRMAKSGKHWVKLFAKMNSGTYNNQWMILDYKKYKPGKPLPNNLLWIIEQLPGIVRQADVTDFLRKQGNWPSYNVAYFKEIYDLSGSLREVKNYGDYFSYDRTSRALIFKRDQGKITNIKTMIKMMRQNNFTKDPLAKCSCKPPYSAVNAISARGDLNRQDGIYPFESLGYQLHGGVDMKLTSSSLFKELKFIAIAGPTYDSDSVPPFQWSKITSKKKVRHVGHPDIWKFKPVIHKWS